MLAQVSRPRELEPQAFADSKDHHLDVALRALLNKDFNLCYHILIRDKNSPSQTRESRQKCCVIYTRLLNEIDTTEYSSLAMGSRAHQVWSELHQVFDDGIPLSLIHETVRACIKHSITPFESIKKACESCVDSNARMTILLDLWPRLDVSFDQENSMLDALQISEGDKAVLKESRIRSKIIDTRNSSSSVDTGQSSKDKSGNASGEYHTTSTQQTNEDVSSILAILAKYWRNQFVQIRRPDTDLVLTNIYRITLMILLIFTMRWQRIRVRRVAERAIDHLKYVFVTAARSL